MLSFFCIFENQKIITMKIFTKVALIAVIGLMGTSILAQNVGRVQRGQRGYTPPPKPRDINYQGAKMDANAIVDQQMPTYTEELGLDAFQQEIMKTMLKEHYNKRETVRADYSMDFGDKQEKFLALDEELYTNLSSFLNQEQIETFKKVQFFDAKAIKKNNKKKKKEKRKKKKKNKENNETEGTQ